MTSKVLSAVSPVVLTTPNNNDSHPSNFLAQIWRNSKTTEVDNISTTWKSSNETIQVKALPNKPSKSWNRAGTAMMKLSF